ncbi:hypothetical protein KJN74_05025 [Candidatus Bathyarchaeota archaeon]|nr:hypothetical protein [Candidatus Bathyarchaeota archaeon]
MADLKNQIAALNQELIPNKEERNNLNETAKKWVKKRNSLNEEVRNIRKEALVIKEKRDNINKQVKDLKNLRNQVTSKGKEKYIKISDLQKKINKLSEERYSGNFRQISEQIKEIDWEIQTNSLPIKEEQELIDQVRQLETELLSQKRIKKVKNKLFDLRTEQRSFRKESQTVHEKLSELAGESQKLHTQMVGILEKAQSLQKEADEAHKKHIETRELAQQKHEKCIELIGKINAIQKQIKETTEKKQAKRQDVLKQELEERALAKLKNGEKLIWEEFQVLAEKGML